MSKSIPSYEIPTEMRDFAEKSVEQARKAFDGFISAASKAANAAETQAHAAQASSREVAQKAISYTEQNIAASFDFAQKVVRAKSLQDLMQVQAEFVKSQAEALQAQLQDGLTPLDVLKASFPAGTLSGAPKIRAMEIIDELEPVRRGLYGGVVGYLDFAGNADVRNAVHEHLGADLTYSMVVGGTHWDHTAATNAAPVGPRPEFFFAPTQIAKRTKEWGQAGLDDRMAVAWTDFATWTNEWVHHVRPRGAAEVQAAFAALVRGVIDPSATIVATMAS